MSELTKQALKVDNNQSFPNNNAGLITPTALRGFNEDMIDSTVNQTVYTADSASFDSRINNITGSGGTTDTGSLLTTASFAAQNLTFTKGDGSQFSLFIPDNSGSTLPSGVVSGSSQVSYPLLSNIPAGIVSGSTQLTGSFVTLSTNQTITGIKAFSNAGVDPGNLNRIEMFNTAKIQFGSFATTRIGSTGGKIMVIEATSNEGANQIQINAGTTGSSAGGANIVSIQAVGNQVGNEISLTSPRVRIIGDTTITGSLNVSSSLTASGLNYPSVDNGAKSFIQTDGAGNLSLQYVDAVFETVRNMSGVTLAKGTPVYISGSTGDNGNAYLADASDVLTMPAVYILGEDLTAGQTGIALVSGLIEGVDTSPFLAGTEIYVAEGGGYSSTRPSGSNSVVQKLGVVTKQGVGGQGVIINQLQAELPNIQEGYAWVGDSGNQPVAIPTSSFGGGGTGNGFPFSGSAVITGSLSVSETIKSQVYINPQTLDGFTIPTGNNAMLVGPVAVSGSIVVEGNSNLLVLSQITSSGATPLPSGVVSGSSQLTSSYDLRYTLSGSSPTIETGSFATTGSNTFIGDQFITGGLFLSSSNEIIFNVPNFPGAPAPGGLSVTGSMSVNGNFAVMGGGFTVGQVNTGKIVGSGRLDIVSDTLVYNDSGVGAPKNFGVSGSAFISGSVSLRNVLNLEGQDPLPSGNIGDLAVSGSSLFFYNGAWTLVV